jgi:uncharacterized membrane protein YhaH (DUF805 family)
MPPLRVTSAGRRVHAIATRSRWLLLLPIAAVGLTGCEGAMWGNLAVLAVSVGIFMGTLSLGRVR